MNLADPSGSSPAENPPGSIIIWAVLISFSNLSTDSINASLFKFLIRTCTTSAPSFLKALAQSSSQFVPGNTGITTFGCSILSLGLEVFLSV